MLKNEYFKLKPETAQIEHLPLPLIFSTITQLIILAFSIIVYETGSFYNFALYGAGMLYLTIFCMCGYWTGAAIILNRRRTKLAKLDVACLRYGFILIFLIFYFLILMIFSF